MRPPCMRAALRGMKAGRSATSAPARQARKRWAGAQRRRLPGQDRGQKESRRLRYAGSGESWQQRRRCALKRAAECALQLFNLFPGGRCSGAALQLCGPARRALFCARVVGAC